MALNVFFEPETCTVHKAYLAFGGMAPTTVLARKACDAMIGRYVYVPIYEYLALHVECLLIKNLNALLRYLSLLRYLLLQEVYIEICFRKWNKFLLEDTYSSLLDELPLPDNVPGGMVKYRRSLTLRYLYLYFLHLD